MFYKKRSKKFMTAFLAAALVLGVCQGIVLPSESKAAGYNIGNPRRDGNNVVTWDCVYFGNYWQKDTNGDRKADRDDAKQPIKWRVLSVNGDDAFLLADQNLDGLAYNEDYNNVTWEECTLRSWLNGYDASANKNGRDFSGDNFLDNAFSPVEQEAIITTKVVTADDPETGSEGGNDTNDKVFCPSRAEMTNSDYGFSSDLSVKDKGRVRTNTGYVEHIGSGGFWWLRSPRDFTYLILYSGHCKSQGGQYNIQSSSYAVCPALHLNLSFTNLWSYAGTVKNEETNTDGGNTGGGTTGAGNTGAGTALASGDSKESSSLEKPVIKSAKNIKGRRIKITLGKKIKGAAGYQIRYSTSKKFKKFSKFNTKKTKITTKKLKKKTYYIRVCAFTVRQNKMIYGAWSKVKKVKVKK